VGINVMIFIQLTWSSSLTRSSTTFARVKISLRIVVRWGISACISDGREYVNRRRNEPRSTSWNAYANTIIYISISETKRSAHLIFADHQFHNIIKKTSGCEGRHTRLNYNCAIECPLPAEGLVIIFWKCTRVHGNAKLGTSLFVKFCMIVMSIYHCSNMLG
jgi:hypothetical protein